MKNVGPNNDIFGIMDILDGPEQVAFNPCIKEEMTPETCRYNPRLGCDCGFHKPDEINFPTNP